MKNDKKKTPKKPKLEQRTLSASLFTIDRGPAEKMREGQLVRKRAGRPGPGVRFRCACSALLEGRRKIKTVKARLLLDLNHHVADLVHSQEESGVVG